MDKHTDSPVLQEYLRILKQRRWTILAVTLICVGIGLAFSVLRPKVYSASATIKFQSQSEDVSVASPGSSLPVDVNQTASASANSRLVTRGDVVRAVKRRVRTAKSVSELQGDVEATVDPNSDLIVIKASTDNAELSAALANAFALETKRVVARNTRRGYQRDIDRLNTERKAAKDAQTQAIYRNATGRLVVLSQVSDPVEISRPATVPKTPASPKPVRDTLLALVVGLILGVGAAFLRHALDRRLRDRESVENELGLPVIGYVRDESLGLSRAAMNGSGEIPPERLEPFRVIRTNAAFMAPDREFSTVVVTSAMPEEGKSTVASWYAYVSAAAGRRTLLVDCDLRKPVISNRLGVEPTPGLSDYLARDAELADIMKPVNVPGPQSTETLTVIPAGGNVFEPAEALGSQRFQDFISTVTAEFDLVIFDSAPLLPVSDTLQLVLEIDQIVLCVRVEQTTRQQAQAGRQALGRLPAKPIGVVVTGARRTDRDEYGYYGYSSYASSSA